MMAANITGSCTRFPSTVWCIAMLWNKAIFQEKAAELRAAGLDPDQAAKDDRGTG